MSSPARLLITGTVVQLQSCELYAGHYSAVIEAHHICPKSWWVAAHKPVDTPMAELCGLCHNNVHAAIDGLIRKLDVSRLPPRAVRMARRALDIAAVSGLAPALTL